MTPPRLVVGVDEAGRGPVLGPLVMCGVAVSPTRAARLTRAGVADSKSFGAGPAAHDKRSALAAHVLAHAEAVVVRVIEPHVIDARVARGELNALEREVASEILRELPQATRIIADGQRMFAPLAADFPALEAKDRAERLHVAVAAASIVAKARRDALFAEIAARYTSEFGEITGGGYDNAGTQRFLAAYVARYRVLPPEARKSWGGATARLVAGVADAPASPPTAE